MENTTLPTNLTTSINEYRDRKVSDPLWSKLNMFSVVAYSVIFVLGTVGNGLVIFITGFRMKKSVHTVWILSLAVADFSFSFFLLTHLVYRALEYHWPFGYIICKLKDTTVFFNLFASIYLLTVISIDRCIAVWCPVWARNYRTPRLASIVVLGVGILALALCFPNLYYKEIYYDINRNTTYCSSSYSRINGGGSIYYAMVVVRFIFGFTIPFCVIVVCYGAIVVRLKRGHLSQSSRPFKVITAVIVAFFVCWFPFHVFHFLKVKAFYGPSKPLVSVGLRLSYCLAYFNSCLNPILYFCLGLNFKKMLRYSLLSALNSAFTEESNHSTTRARSSAALESHGL